MKGPAKQHPFSRGQSDSCASVAAVSMSSGKGLQHGIRGLQTSVMVQCSAPFGHLHLMWSCVAARLWLHPVILGQRVHSNALLRKRLQFWECGCELEQSESSDAISIWRDS